MFHPHMVMFFEASFVSVGVSRNSLNIQRTSVEKEVLAYDEQLASASMT